jgi:hypothetical protein
MILGKKQRRLALDRNKGHKKNAAVFLDTHYYEFIDKEIFSCIVIASNPV